MENEIYLYNGVAPGSENVIIQEEMFEEDWEHGEKKLIVKNIIKPSFIPFIPEKGIGIGVIVIPGGAYRREVINMEGYDVAEWLNSMGIAAFVMKYRMPVNEHETPLDVPLMDMQRAMRIIRSRAIEFGIDENKIGAMGFSAGGHAASVIGTCFDRKFYEETDKIDTISARPDFIVLGYSPISYDVFVEFGEGRGEHKQHLFAMFERYSTERLVTKDTPPAFLFVANDDCTTHAEHSVKFYMAARRKGVPAEIHIFKEGNHGFGLGKTRELAGSWTSLFSRWLKSLYNI